MNNVDQQLAQFFQNPWALGLLLVWTIFWKGLALWRSAGKKQIIWFVLILVVNTMGLLEIAYVFYLNKWDIDNGRVLEFIKKLGKNKK